jgi:tetratricopeptide (TPR) repeat protein
VDEPKNNADSKDITEAQDLDSTKDGEIAQKEAAAPISRVTAGWMERAESFMAADRPEDALAYFDAILVTEPKNAEALRKKGMALEKLGRLQAALEYYNRAIAADSNLTIAHLQKGALCSQLEKHSEAIESYEQALHTREGEQAA